MSRFLTENPVSQRIDRIVLAMPYRMYVVKSPNGFSHEPQTKRRLHRTLFWVLLSWCGIFLPVKFHGIKIIVGLGLLTVVG